MLKLLLLRHAKSDWSKIDALDIDRPLNNRGRAAAPLMGAHMARHQIFPDRILCSTAQRTRETLAHLLPHFPTNMEIRITEDLYREANGDYIETIQAFGGGARTLMVIAHNPGMQSTAQQLTSMGDEKLIAEMNEKFPTAGLAILTFDAHRWSEITPKTGRLIAFLRPRLLLENSAANDREATLSCT